MHLYKKSPRAWLKPLIFALVSLCAVLLLSLGSGWFGKNSRTEQTELLRSALDKAIVSCYATEGRYPESLDYLVENYGIQIDRDDYLVIYDAFADNVRPRLQVIWIGED